MSKLKALIVDVIPTPIKAVGKAEMQNVLSDVKEHYGLEIYQVTLRGLYADFCLLKEVTLRSKRRMDSGIVDLVLQALRDSAHETGIKFPWSKLLFSSSVVRGITWCFYTRFF